MSDTQTELERLRTLYAINKKLSVFTQVDESFSAIVACAAESFPLTSAVLIEHWEKKPRTAIWSIENVSQEVTKNAIHNAKKAYSYFSGDSAEKARELIEATTPENVLVHSDRALIFNKTENGYYITVPLVIDNLPPLGALQLEGSASLDENDLDFVIALANLVSVALDRYYKTKWEALRRENEVQTLTHEKELRESFVNLLTHDLRAPFSVILGAAQLILRKVEDSEMVKRNTQMIVAQVNRASHMVSDLLDANRIRSGEVLPTKKEKTDLSELITTTIAELSITHGERYVYQNPGTIECEVDRHGVRRIIENLSTNAIKYGSPTAAVKISLRETPMEVVLSVANEGSYITPEDQKTLFQQFRRTDSANASNVRGWGIGLTLVRAVAEAHGGKVSVSSDEMTGTEFSVSFPKKNE